MSIFLLSSHSAKKPSKNPSDAAAWAIDLHGLCVFEQTDRGRKLRVFYRRSQAGEGLGVGHVRRHFKDLAGEMIDPIQQAAAAGNENAGADIIDERLLFDGALEQLKSFA